MNSRDLILLALAVILVLLFSVDGAIAILQVKRVWHGDLIRWKLVRGVAAVLVIAAAIAAFLLLPGA
jgi:hypothetical protein